MTRSLFSTGFVNLKVIEIFACSLYTKNEKRDIEMSFKFVIANFIFNCLSEAYVIRIEDLS